MLDLDNWIYSVAYNKRFRRMNGQWVSDHIPDLAECGVTQSQLALIAPDHVLTNGGSLFDGLDERAVCRRYVGTHFYEIGT